MPNQTRLQNLREKRAQLDAEIARLEARKRLEERKADTRRKILIGAVMLQEMSDRDDFAEWVNQTLAQRLDKPRDRKLFGLEPLPPK